MAELVRVRFTQPHGVYNAGEIAGLVPAVAERLCGGKHPVAVVVKDFAQAMEQADLERALNALPENVKAALKARIEADIKAVRKPLQDEVEKLHAEAAPVAQQLADSQAEAERLKARIAELESKALETRQTAGQKTVRK